MTVAQARATYLSVAGMLARSACPHTRRDPWPCRWCQRDYLLADAMSIALDVAMAAESDERLRASVAY